MMEVARGVRSIRSIDSSTFCWGDVMKPWTMLAMGVLSCTGTPAQEQSSAPLRVFIRAGVKTHGPGEHDHPAFLKDWTELLKSRGAIVDGAMQFPSAEQLEKTDVL